MKDMFSKRLVQGLFIGMMFVLVCGIVTRLRIGGISAHNIPVDTWTGTLVNRLEGLQIFTETSMIVAVVVVFIAGIYCLVVRLNERSR